LQAKSFTKKYDEKSKANATFQNSPQRTLSSQRELGFRIFHTLLSNCVVEKYISGQKGYKKGLEGGGSAEKVAGSGVAMRKQGLCR